MEFKEIFLHKSPRKNGLEWNSQILRRANARGSAADIIYRMWRISLLYGSDYDADADANFGCHSLSRLSLDVISFLLQSGWILTFTTDKVHLAYAIGVWMLRHFHF